MRIILRIYIKMRKKESVHRASLEEEITHYEKDFDEYIFDSKEAFIQSEKWFTLDGRH